MKAVKQDATAIFLLLGGGKKNVKLCKIIERVVIYFGHIWRSLGFVIGSV